LLALSAVLLATQAARAQDVSVPLPQNDYRDVGLIDMPDARMAPDGEISMGASFFKNSERYNFDFQALPWLATSFVYSGLGHFEPEFPVYWDRSFQIEARLFNETKITPAISVGIDDLIGTQIYGGEYLVASKQFGNFDATLGIGWGDLGSTNLLRNPLTVISQSFAVRSTSAPGAFTVGSFFHGPTGLFGGVKWQTPIDGLTLITEYSSNAYIPQKISGNFDPASQLNYGASYQVFDNVTLGLAWFYGRSIEGSVSFQLDPTRDPFPQRIGPAPIQPRIRSNDEQQQAINALLQHNVGSDPVELISSSDALVDALWARDQSVDAQINSGVLFLTTRNDAKSLCRDAAEIAGRYVARIATVDVSDGKERLRCMVITRPQVDPGVTDEASAILSAPPPPSSVMTIDMRTSAPTDAKSVTAMLSDAVKKQNILVNAIDYEGSEITLYYTNYYYFSEAEAVKRVTQLLMTEAPANVERFRLMPLAAGIPQREFDVLRATAERDISQNGALDLKNSVTTALAPMQNPILTSGEAGAFPRFSWGAFPQFRQQLFDPNNPFAVQLLAAADVGVELTRGLTFNGEGEVSIYDNFNVTRPADSILPHVRTDYLKFFTQGKDGIGQLDLEYRIRLAPDVFATARAGYLESMYVGAGGEILWRPDGERWAVGADLYDVQERGFDRLLDLQHYQVVTGHVSLYWASPWYDLNFEVRAGQYLAGDRGITVMATRRFSTGVELGAFFTRTNVSAAQFGEGSFDKGFIIRIPLGWAAPINSQGQIYQIIRPLQRDGGQALDNDATLYEETRGDSEAEMFLQTHENF
jgi:hypothetical protein